MKLKKVIKINSNGKGFASLLFPFQEHVLHVNLLCFAPSQTLVRAIASLTYVGIFQGVQTTCWHDSMRKARRAFHTFAQSRLWVLVDNWTASPIGQDEIHSRFRATLIRFINFNIGNFLNMSTYRKSHWFPSITTLYQFRLDDFNRWVDGISTLCEWWFTEWFGRVEWICVEYITRCARIGQ